MEEIAENLLNIETRLSSIDLSFRRIQRKLDNSLKCSPELQELISFLGLINPDIDELLSSINTYLITNAIIDKELNITPIESVLGITETISYSKLLSVILSHLKID
jgi:hypothetical protein